MKPKLLAVLTVVLLLGAEAPKEDSAVKEVEQAITALNKAFETGDPNAIIRLMTGDHVAITPYYGGPRSRADQVKSLPVLKLAEYKTGKLKITLLDKDVALVTYPLTMKGTYIGKELAAKSYASSVWVRKEGKWQEAFYQETALGGK